MQVAWKNAGRLVGRRRTQDSWGADSTAIGRQLAELNTLQVALALTCHRFSDDCM